MSREDAIDDLIARLASAAEMAGDLGLDALEAWRSGALLEQALSGNDVARIVKRSVAAGGIDAKVFSGHSLRAGFITSALDARVDPLKIMPISGT